MWQTLQRVVLIVAMGIALGLFTNALSSKGIPLITPPKKAPKAEEFVPLDKARELWASGSVLFFDARKAQDYEAGHIANALNLPVEDFQAYFPKVAPMLTPESSVVVYCDGKECELSHHLADQLHQLGYTNVHMLFNGWTAWKEAGFPIETGGGK